MNAQVEAGRQRGAVADLLLPEARRGDSDVTLRALPDEGVDDNVALRAGIDSQSRGRGWGVPLLGIPRNPSTHDPYSVPK
eukprot:gene6948-biopygen20953